MVASREYTALCLEDIAEMAEQLTPDNVSRLSAIIKCRAQDRLRCLEKLVDPNDEISNRAIKRLKWIVKDCSRLCTGNVAHNKPGLVYYSKQMSKYIRQHLND
nr:MAG TPA: hypothetical protein [Caudoviricetes sp.]